MHESGPRRACSFNEAALVVVQDQLQPCPYLPDLLARMPLQWPKRTFLGKDVDAFLAAGYRRSGAFLYRTQCPSCQACEPTRVLVEEFQLRSSQRRVLKRGDAALRLEVGAGIVDERRVDLFNRHRNQRQLCSDSENVDQMSYKAFLLDTFCQTVELGVYLENQLIAVAIVDIGELSASAVYTFFDPRFSRYSLGTYAILKQLEWCRQSDRKFLYLGLYVAENAHLNYKSHFQPQERRVGGRWQRVD